MIIAATGHRPDKLGGYRQKTIVSLASFATVYLEAEQPDEVIVGMADGWDMAVATACFIVGVPFIAAVPFEGQEKRWSEVSQYRYRSIIAEAQRVEIICDYPSTRAFQIRNEWMVDRAGKVAALWDGSWGGTFNCVRYAEKKGVPVDNLWNAWDLRELLG